VKKQLAFRNSDRVLKIVFSVKDSFNKLRTGKRKNNYIAYIITWL